MLNKEIKLFNGRTLSYRTLGPINGVPLLVFPGTPGSRFFSFVDEELLEQFNIQVFTLERPGYGNSTAVENYKITDWPKDIASFIEQLNLKQVHLLGYSGGGPFALASGALIPEKVLSITAVACTGFYGEPRLYEQLSPELQKLCSLIRSNEQQLKLDTIKSLYSTPEKLMENLLAGSSARDKLIFSKPSIQPGLIANFAGGFQQGFDPAAREFINLFQTSWGFRFEDIQCPVYLWFGKQDAFEVHAIDGGAYFAEKIPNNKLMLLREEGASLLWTKAAEILQQIIA